MPFEIKTPVPAERFLRDPTRVADLSRGDVLALAQAADQFNRGLYFECHETLEGLWLRRRGSSRDFFQALILVSVGFHHLQRGNRVGALRTFAKAQARFEAYPACYLGFNVAGERDRLLARCDALEAGTCEGLKAEPWRFDGIAEEDQM